MITSSWSNLLNQFVDRIYRDNQETVYKIINHPKINSSISQSESDFRNSVQIGESGYFLNTNSDTESKLELMTDIASLTGLEPDGITIEINRD